MENRPENQRPNTREIGRFVVLPGHCWTSQQWHTLGAD